MAESDREIYEEARTHLTKFLCEYTEARPHVTWPHFAAVMVNILADSVTCGVDRDDALDAMKIHVQTFVELVFDKLNCGVKMAVSVEDVYATPAKKGVFE